MGDRFRYNTPTIGMSLILVISGHNRQASLSTKNIVHQKIQFYGMRQENL